MPSKTAEPSDTAKTCAPASASPARVTRPEPRTGWRGSPPR